VEPLSRIRWRTRTFRPQRLAKSIRRKSWNPTNRVRAQQRARISPVCTEQTSEQPHGALAVLAMRRKRGSVERRGQLGYCRPGSDAVPSEPTLDRRA
jgi:hypothetical protein